MDCSSTRRAPTRAAVVQNQVAGCKEKEGTEDTGVFMVEDAVEEGISAEKERWQKRETTDAASQ